MARAGVRVLRDNSLLKQLAGSVQNVGATLGLNESTFARDDRLEGDKDQEKFEALARFLKAKDPEGLGQTREEATAQEGGPLIGQLMKGDKFATNIPGAKEDQFSTEDITNIVQTDAGSTFAKTLLGKTQEDVIPEAMARELGIDPSIGPVTYTNAAKIGYDIADVKKAEQEALKITATAKKNKSDFTSETRKEFDDHQTPKDFIETRRKYQVMSAAWAESLTTDNFVAVDQAIISLFNKMTDPESVVRESEYIRTSEDLSLANRLMGRLEKMGTGGAGMTQEDRKALMSIAGEFMSASQGNYDNRVSFYDKIAAAGGGDKDLIVNSGTRAGIPDALNPEKDLVSVEERKYNTYKAQGMKDDEIYNRIARETR